MKRTMRLIIKLITFLIVFTLLGWLIAFPSLIGETPPEITDDDLTALDKLLDDCISDDPETRTQALQDLLEQAKPLTKSLLKLVKQGNETESNIATIVLGFLGEKSVRKRLIKLIRSESSPLRVKAIESSCYWKTFLRSDVKTLLNLMKDEDLYVRISAARALGHQVSKTYEKLDRITRRGPDKIKDIKQLRYYLNALYARLLVSFSSRHFNYLCQILENQEADILNNALVILYNYLFHEERQQDYLRPSVKSCIEKTRTILSQKSGITESIKVNTIKYLLKWSPDEWFPDEILNFLKDKNPILRQVVVQLIDKDPDIIDLNSLLVFARDPSIQELDDGGDKKIPLTNHIETWLKIKTGIEPKGATFEERLVEWEEYYKNLKTLVKRWEYYFLSSTKAVRLKSPSGWGHGDRSQSAAPWLISSPAIGPSESRRKELIVITGTEEGAGEFHPGNANTVSDGRYLCVDHQGKFLWQYQTHNNAGRASPAVVKLNGKLTILGGSTSGWMVHCFRKSTRLWRFPSKNKANFLSSPTVLSSNVSKKARIVAIVAIDLTGTLYCLNARGKLIWQYPQDRNKKFSSPSFSTPLIYDINRDGDYEVVVGFHHSDTSQIHCLDLSTKRVKWIKKIRWTASGRRWGMGQVSSPAVLPLKDRTAITLGIGNNLYAFNGNDGEVLWKFPTKGFIYSSPAVGDCDGNGVPDVVVGSMDGGVYCVNGLTGKSVWEYKTKGTIYASPALATSGKILPYQIEWGMFRHDAQRTGLYQNNHTGPFLNVYIGSDDGYLHLINGRSGKRIGKIKVKFPDLIIAKRNQQPLKFTSSPCVADIDGDQHLEVLFTLVNRLVCVGESTSGHQLKPIITSGSKAKPEPSDKSPESSPKGDDKK